MAKFLASTLLLLLLMTGWQATASSSQAVKSERHQLIEQAWQAVNDRFYDTRFHGIDWPHVRQEALQTEYANQQMTYAAIRSMLARLNEPATRFLTAEQFTALLKEFTAPEHIGVGLIELLSADLHDQSRKLTVITPVPNSSASRAGLRPGDIIETINSQPTAGLSLADAMTRLRGPDATSVTITVRRGNRLFIIELPRRTVRIPNPPVQAMLKEARGQRFLYIRLEQFTQNSGKEMRQTITHLLNPTIYGLILDLRNNPGGAMSACQEVAGIFLGEQVLAKVKGRNETTVNLKGVGDKLTDIPIAVLVNEGSASAAEVIAGALQAHHRAIVVGSRTFGKGLVHSAQALTDGSALMITTGRLQTLTGRDILIHGIQPDYPVAMSESPLLNPASIAPASSKDRQFVRAVEKLLTGQPMLNSPPILKSANRQPTGMPVLAKPVR